MPLELEAKCGASVTSSKSIAPHYVDQRELGMTHSPLGMIRTPSELIVRGRLVRDEGNEG